MTASLSPEQRSQLIPVLGSLARMLATGAQLNDEKLRTLLIGVDLDSNPAALEELQRWAKLLKSVREQPTAEQRQVAVETLLLRGLPEAPVLLAVAAVAGSGTPPTPPPAGGTTVSPQPPNAPTRLHASVTNLDFGILQPGQTTTLEFDVQGGPGHVVVENDHVQVYPMQFGAGTTHLRVGIKPLASGLLFTSLKLVTAGETLEVPIMAQWQDGGAAPAQLVLDPLVVPPPPMRQPPKPIVVPQPPVAGYERMVPPVIVVQPPPKSPPVTPPNPPVTPPKSGTRSPSNRATSIGLVLFLMVGAGLFVAYMQQRPITVQVAGPFEIPALVEVPAGPFLMGSSDSDTDAQADEKPQQTVDLPTYSIGTTEVTNAQFRPFVENDGYTNRAYWTDTGWAWRQSSNQTQPYYWNDATWNGADYPVVGVTWYEAVAYCNWLSVQTGLEFRLPTEAEWEKAARGTDGWIYPWGNTWEAGRANSGEAGLQKTAPVGSYPSGASPYDALDMAGNVWEWTRSEYTPYPYDPHDGREDTRNPAQKRFTLRGGSLLNQPLYLRASGRGDIAPEARSGGVGFRVSRYP